MLSTFDQASEKNKYRGNWLCLLSKLCLPTNSELFFLAKIPHCVTSLFFKCSAQIKINTLKTQNYECEYHRGHFMHHAGIQNAKCPQNTMSIS